MRMRNREEGQSALEFALVLPVLLLVVCGILDFGWMFYNKLSVENGCREGARYACVNSSVTDIETLVKDKVLANIPGSLKDDTEVTVTFTDTTNPTLGDVKVQVSAQVQTLTPVLGTVYGNSMGISYDIVMKVES